MSESLWPLDCSTLGFQDFHYYLEFAQSHVTEVVMPSSHLILCRLLLLLPSIFSSILLFFFVLILLMLWYYVLYLFYRELCRTSCIVQGSLLSDLWWPKEKGEKKTVNICTCLGAQLCPTLWPYGLSPARHICTWGFSTRDSPGENTGVGCHTLLQGIVTTQGLNPGLHHCRRILYHLSHQGSQEYWSA